MCRVVHQPKTVQLLICISTFALAKGLRRIPNKLMAPLRRVATALTNLLSGRRIALHSQDRIMLTATTPNPANKHLLSAMHLSLLALVLLFVAVMVQQKSVTPSVAERGFVGKFEQLVAAPYSSSLKLHKDSDPARDRPDPAQDWLWGPASSFGILAITLNQAFNSYGSHRSALPSTPQHLSPPLRAPPLA